MIYRMIFYVNHTKHYRVNKPRIQEKPYAPSLAPLHAHSYIYSTPFVVFPTFFPINVPYNILSSLKPHLSSIPTPMVRVRKPPVPCPLLVSWWSLSWSLTRDTLLEMTTCVATYVICSRRSFNTLLLTIEPLPTLPSRL